jgi:L-alanine-DL-glutamate epimerase-like enolase superfamily enzyme
MHSFYTGPGLAATLQLAATTPGIRWVEFPDGELVTPLLAEPIRAEDGWAVPTGNGLGVTVSEEAVTRHPLGDAGPPFVIAAR